MGDRLRLVVDLVAADPGELRADVAYVDVAGHLWQLAEVGCIVCIDTDTATLLHNGEPVAYVCVACGELEEIPYAMSKTYRVTLGAISRDGFEEVTDSMLFPKTMSDDEKTALINSLLDEIDGDECEETGEQGPQ